MTADLAEYRQGDLDPYNECRMMDAEKRKMKKRKAKKTKTKKAKSKKRLE